MSKILVVDDVEENITLLTYELEDDYHDVIALRNGQECLDQVKTIAPDLIFLDISMPIMDGMTALKALKSDSSTAKIPVIMVSANENDEQIIEALDLGAHDYVSKPVIYPILAARVRSALRLIEQQHALSLANKSLALLASQDPLTEVYNRRYFFRRADIEFSKALRHNRSLAVIMIDADHFKMVNDQFGHAMGDQALLRLSKVCRDSLRSSDFIGRLGGEEFAICCPETDIDGAKQVAERIRHDMATVDIIYNGKSCRVSVSIGVTALLEADQNFDQLVQRSDQLLYSAKEGGRNRISAA